MEAATSAKRASMDGAAYNHLFPPVSGSNEVIKKSADLADTVKFIPKAVHQTLPQTAKLAIILKGATLRQTCSNIWHFLHGHVNYQKDEQGKEQIRSPARAWRDRKMGIDCDCFSVFISSILTNLGIPHKLRITKYSKDSFQHIYPIVPYGEGYITMDCVTDEFDYEVPYTEKKDVNMELQFLNGFENIDGTNPTDGLAELGRLLKKKAGKLTPFRPMAIKKNIRNIQQQQVIQRKSPNVTLPGAGAYNIPIAKKKKFGGKLLNVVNKVNPATVLLRNGILASMKLNTRNVASRLRWSYLSAQQAAARDIDPAKFQQLVAARMRLEKIFFGAGGKPANLRKAIISGKGNKDRAVSGLEGFDGSPEGIAGMNEYTPMPILLGTEVYQDENGSSMEGFGQLGEPVTLSSIAAAAGVIAGIAGMIKEVGSIFRKKQAPGAADFDEATNAEASLPVPIPATLPPMATPPYAAAPADNNSPAYPPPVPTTSQAFDTETPVRETAPANSNTLPVVKQPTDTGSNPPATKDDPPPANTADNSGTGGDPPAADFWDKNKSWLKPVAIGAGTLTLLGLVYAATKKEKPPQQPGRRNDTYNGLSGTPAKKKNHRRKYRQRFAHKKSVGLSD